MLLHGDGAELCRTRNGTREAYRPARVRWFSASGGPAGWDP